MTVEELRDSGLIVMEAISGSQSFGLATETSDTDIHGVYIATPRMLAKLEKELPPEVADDRSNTVFWEMGKFLDMLGEGKPNALELLYSPQNCILYRDALIMDLLKPHDQYVSHLCINTYHRYAMAQVSRARGQNKKIVNPMPEQRQSVLDFCYAVVDGRSVPVLEWLDRLGVDQKDCGLAAIDHVPNQYGVYYQKDAQWAQGLVRCIQTSNEVCLSSIPRGVPCLGHLYWNKDAYSMHCKKHKQYWQWVTERNEERYASTEAHGKGYDAKNMMHTIRLLRMGLEIARGQGVILDRSFEREELLAIKRGEYEYEDLLKMAEDSAEALTACAGGNPLPEPPSRGSLETTLHITRMLFWQKRGLYV